MTEPSLDEVLLGFDVRRVGDAAARLWNAQRRDTYLLRDVPLPLSVDTRVWPSLLEDSAWACVNGPFRAELAAVRRQLAETPTPPHWLVAATWHRPPHGVAARLHADCTTPRARDPSWPFLGFDVADPGISGLTNCGYFEGIERDGARARWAHALNPHHLFDSLDVAIEFAGWSDVRVPEHAPFHVLGLWRIP